MLKLCINSGLLVLLLTIQGCSYVQTKLKPVVSSIDVDITSPEINNEYGRIVQLMHEQHWEQAEAALLVFTDEHPQHAGPWLNLGISRENLGNQDAAESAFKTAISKNRGNPVAYNRLGIFYRHNGQLDKALTMYKSALETAPDYPDAHWNIGILYDLYLSQQELALQHYLRYQQLTGSSDPQLEGWISILIKETGGSGV